MQAPPEAVSLAQKPWAAACVSNGPTRARWRVAEPWGAGSVRSPRPRVSAGRAARNARHFCSAASTLAKAPIWTHLAPGPAGRGLGGAWVSRGLSPAGAATRVGAGAGVDGAAGVEAAGGVAGQAGRSAAPGVAVAARAELDLTPLQATTARSLRSRSLLAFSQRPAGTEVAGPP